MRTERFEKIVAWQPARNLTCKDDKLTKETKSARDFGMKRKIRDGYNRAVRPRSDARDAITYLIVDEEG
ncbi:MAG: hypothetical protein PVH37_10655 [Desulfobacterales bacterium]|jgi:hypothetical protein